MQTENGTRGGSESESENLLRSCTAALTRRDFTGCHKLANRVPRSDPNISVYVDQILAIADVLGAAERRLSDKHFDWYAVLQLRRVAAANRDLARRQFKKLVRLLDPNKNKFPFSDEALMRVREAWFVLSDPSRRARYESEIANPQQKPCKRNGDGDENGHGGDLDATTTFWTMCPYCWYLHEYEKKYEDCSFRCGNCRKTFHGVAVKPPEAEAVVAGGKQQYYCYHVSLPLRYPLVEDRNVLFGEGLQQSNGKRRMRFKTVANRVKRKKGCVDPNSDSDLDARDGVLEFTKGDGDVFVGVRFGQ